MKYATKIRFSRGDPPPKGGPWRGPEGEIQGNDQVYITNIRQKSALQSALESLQFVKKSIGDGMPEDFYSIDLMDAYESLGSIIGESVGEDLIHEIFSKFCMGK